MAGLAFVQFQRLTQLVICVALVVSYVMPTEQLSATFSVFTVYLLSVRLTSDQGGSVFVRHWGCMREALNDSIRCCSLHPVPRRPRPRPNSHD